MGGLCHQTYLISHHFLQAERDQRLKIRYCGVSAKDHEQQQRAGEGSPECNVELTTALSGHEAIMKNIANKQSCIFNLGL